MEAEGEVDRADLYYWFMKALTYLTLPQSCAQTAEGPVLAEPAGEALPLETRAGPVQWVSSYGITQNTERGSD